MVKLPSWSVVELRVTRTASIIGRGYLERAVVRSDVQESPSSFNLNVNSVSSPFCSYLSRESQRARSWTQTRSRG